MSEERLRAEFWRALLAALEQCQRTIDLLERLDAGSNQYIGEWEELDSAFAHMHNVRRWIGRAWIGSQEQRRDSRTDALDTSVFRRAPQKRRIDRREAHRTEANPGLEPNGEPG